MVTAGDRPGPIALRAGGLAEVTTRAAATSQAALLPEAAAPTTGLKRPGLPGITVSPAVRATLEIIRLRPEARVTLLRPEAALETIRLRPEVVLGVIQLPREAVAPPGVIQLPREAARREVPAVREETTTKNKILSSRNAV